MSNESAQTVSETISSSGSGSSDETVSQKANDLFDYMLTKSLALCGMIALICVIILLIFIVIYCNIKKKKQRAVQSESTFGLSSIMKDKSKPNSRHFEFKKLQNTSSMGNDINSANKENMSLSEIRVKNLKLDANNSANLTSESGPNTSDRGKKKKKGSRNNTEGEDGNNSSGRKKKVSQKKLEKEIKKQIGKYVNQDE